MSAQPFFSGEKNGARFSWHIQGQVGDYSSQVASITGLSQSIDFSGGLQQPQITITLAGNGLWGGEGVGDYLWITQREEQTGQDKVWGYFWIRAIDITQTNGQNLTIITADDYSANYLPSDYNYYNAEAMEPRTLALEWLYAATNLSIDQAAYTDSYQRDLSRVAAGAATLAGLAGFSDTTATLYLRKGDQTDTSTWTGSWTTVTGAAQSTDIQWSAAPGLPDNRDFLGRIPLYWHQAGQGMQFTWTGRSTFPAVAGQKCQFPVGAVEGLYLSIVTLGGTDYQGTVFMSNHYLQPNSTEDVEITYKSRKEAREFYRQNAVKMGPGPDYGWGRATYTAGEKSDIIRWGGSRKIKLTGVAQYTGTLASFYNASRAAITPGAPALDYSPSEATSFGEVTLCEDSDPVGFDGQRFIATAQLQFIPQRLDAAWQSAGVTSAAALSEGYQIRQVLHPITIAADYITRALMQQACILGSIGIYSGQGRIIEADTCPESGVVFGAALTIYSVSEIAAANEYPMAQGYDISAKAPQNADYSYTVTDSKGTGANITLNLLQGLVQGWQQPVESGGNKYLSISSTNWQSNPGGLADRWTGSQTTGGNLTGFSALSFPLADRGACIIDADGNLYSWTTNISNFTAAAKYAVRGQDGVEKQLFCAEANIGIDNPPEGGKQSAPYLDGFPLFSFLKAHGRVYSDNYNRQSWRLRTTMTFAPLVPGDVVAVQLPQIFDGQKCLALVLSISISTDSFPELEIVPMHIITSDDYNNFSNLGGVL